MPNQRFEGNLSKIEVGRMEIELTDFDLPSALDNALTLVRERAQDGRHDPRQSIEARTIRLNRKCWFRSSAAPIPRASLRAVAMNV